MYTSGAEIPSAHWSTVDWVAPLMNIMVPKRLAPSATSCSPFLRSIRKLPTGLMSAGDGSLWPNSSMEVSGSVTSWKIRWRKSRRSSALRFRFRVDSLSAAPMTCSMASGLTRWRNSVRSSSRLRFSSGFCSSSCRLMVPPANG